MFRDCLGNTILKGDKVVAIHTGNTNSTLMVGEVTDTTAKSVQFRVIHPGEKVGYAYLPQVGELRRSTASHKVLRLDD